jgi:hypothetical protein
VLLEKYFVVMHWHNTFACYTHRRLVLSVLIKVVAEDTFGRGVGHTLFKSATRVQSVRGGLFVDFLHEAIWRCTGGTVVVGENRHQGRLASVGQQLWCLFGAKLGLQREFNLFTWITVSTGAEQNEGHEITR